MISRLLASEPPRSQRRLQLPGRSALPPREGEPNRTAEAGAREGGVRSSPPAPALTFPLRSPRPGAPPPTPSPPPQALPNPGCRGKESAGKQEGWKSRSEPAVAVPPGRPCDASAGRPGLGNGRPLQMRWQLLQLWLRRGGRPGPRSPRGRQERSSRRGCAQPLVARRCRCPGLSPALPGRPGVQGKSKEKSEAHRRCAPRSPWHRRPAALLRLAFPGAPGSAAGAAHELPT